MAKLGGGSPISESKQIEIYGLLSTWTPPNSPFSVKCVSTYANPISDTGHGHLLDELKPLRDRMPVKELTQLDSVLQRSLNDARVAHDLIPYLTGSGNPLSFFPAVLGVLIPKEFLASEEIEYPSRDEKGDDVVYGEMHWKYTPYEMEGEKLPFVKLTMSLHRTNVVVIDGQHRVNAFRYLTDKKRISKGVYDVFYQDVNEMSDLDASLPVTLIWFESNDPKQNPIKPKHISRQLFIDVNSNARSVSSSRQILLDDRDVCSLATQELYQTAASRSFELSKFSLFHSAFDMDSELAKGKMPRVSLTTPEIINDCNWWLLFGSTSYDSLDKYQVERDRRQPFEARFSQVLDVNCSELCKFVDEKHPQVKNPASERKFRELSRDKISPAMMLLFDKFNLIQGHFEACVSTEKWVNEEGTDGIGDVWENVFCGGEGLYWVFKDPLLKKSESVKIKKYQNAIVAIEKQFTKFRAKASGVESQSSIDKCLDAFVSKAFQVGFANAIVYLAYNGHEGSLIEASEQLVSKLNKKTMEEWVCILTELKPMLMGAADPKKWPAYQKLFLRIYDSDCDKVFDEVSTRPEYRCFVNSLDAKIEFIHSEEDEIPKLSARKSFCKKTFQELKETLDKSGLLRSDFEQEAQELGLSYFNESLEHLFNDEE